MNRKRRFGTLAAIRRVRLQEGIPLTKRRVLAKAVNSEFALETISTAFSESVDIQTNALGDGSFLDNLADFIERMFEWLVENIDKIIELIGKIGL